MCQKTKHENIQLKMFLSEVQLKSQNNDVLYPSVLGVSRDFGFITPEVSTSQPENKITQNTGKKNILLLLLLLSSCDSSS